MVHVTFINADGKSYETTIKDGQTILRAARQGHVPLRHKCGGQASCTTCKVTIEDQSYVSPPNDKERYKLGDTNIHNHIRLSCQTKVFGNVHATIPEDPYQARIRQLLKQQNEHD
ncbi:2Fe-2S iron-sulfur cluster-binding protein [Lentibacillus saliphilus]|uniref:2Fe-2S iron-sulfur cluster-binding protein n=1 Tax=Lentibacillus saliphilus TaxID=2737028 RepID=UPI001C300A5B|nr:2Fe-2S iron-sulfur cluster-binding protein [Lentibacillus saliphilus]